ncbi:MAG: molybdate ABC transporter permease subunit [Acidobacteria bacterium]|nr:MAG: molybdate ABC transporter permease subunit [Acidobacteriota bacterium]PYQ66649.1 MAG: molybdate ABC transporter permease subunit [Acidobacteriota bacterium]
MSASDLSILLLTLRVAAVSTLSILPFGIAAAWLLSRWKGRGKVSVETLLSLPLVLPPTAVGLVLLEMLTRSGPLGRLLDRAGVEILFTWKAVVLATAVMSFPLLVRPARAALEEVDPRLIGIGRSLGHGAFDVFTKVSLPLAWRGILAGTLLAFSRAFGEFGATILVAGNIPGRTQTLALAIFHRTQIGQDAAAFRLVALTVVVAFAAVWTTEVLQRRRSRFARSEP